jgi:hypothetical protein
VLSAIIGFEYLIIEGDITKILIKKMDIDKSGYRIHQQTIHLCVPGVAAIFGLEYPCGSERIPRVGSKKINVFDRFLIGKRKNIPVEAPIGTLYYCAAIARDIADLIIYRKHTVQIPEGNRVKRCPRLSAIGGAADNTRFADADTILQVGKRYIIDTFGWIASPRMLPGTELRLYLQAWQKKDENTKYKNSFHLMKVIHNSLVLFNGSIV